MTHVMSNHWKRTFTLAPFVFFIIFHPFNIIFDLGLRGFIVGRIIGSQKLQY